MPLVRQGQSRHASGADTLDVASERAEGRPCRSVPKGSGKVRVNGRPPKAGQRGQ